MPVGGILTPIIEAFPQLDASHCTLLTGVPRATGSTWIFDSSIEGTNTTRLYLNSAGKWVSSVGAGNEIACAAANAAASDTSGSIWLYPSAKIGAYVNQRMDLYSTIFDVGSYLVVNENTKQQYFVNKETSAAWSSFDTLYYDWQQNKAYKTNGATRMSTEGTVTATPSGTSRGLVWFRYPYYEESARQSFQNVTPILLPKITGAVNISDDVGVCKDISGFYFQLTSSAVRHGIFEDYISLETPAASASEFYAYKHDGNTKITLTPDNVKLSSWNPTFVYIVPTFGTNGYEQILNSSSTDVVQRIISGGFLDDVLTRQYNYYYQIRKYRILDESGALFNKRAWKPNLSIDVPSSLTWTRSPCADPWEWSPPGAIDQSSTHRFVLTGDYSNQVQPTWALKRKTPLTAASSNYYNPRILGIKTPPIATIGTNYLTMLPDQNGRSQIHDLNDPGYVVDINKVWNLGFAGFVGGSTSDCTVSIKRLNADGTETTLLAPTMMNRAVWFVQDGTTYLRYTYSTSLAALGETDPFVYASNYRADFYHRETNSPGVNNEWAFSATFGQPLSDTFDFIGPINSWNPDSIPPFPLDVPPISMRTNKDDEITTSFVEGYSDNFKIPTMSIVGGLTHSLSALGGKFYLLKTTSNFYPSITDTDLEKIYLIGEAQRTVKRLSDGMFLHYYMSFKAPTQGGCIWSRKAKYTRSGYYNPTYGTIGTYLEGFQVTFNLNDILVDIAPDASSETFEVETSCLFKYFWHNKRDTYGTFYDKQTIVAP